MKLDLRRTAVTLTAACALAIVAAAPAAANPTHDAAITGGTMTLVSNDAHTWSFDLTSDPTSTCPAPSLTLANANESGTTGTSTVTTISTTTRFFYGGTAAANHYIIAITGSSTATGGTASSWTTATTPDSFTGLALRLTIKIYSGNSTCTVSATNLKCTWNVTLPLAGTYDNDLSHPAIGDIATIVTTTPGTLNLGGACAAPFTTYTSGTAATTGFTAQLTT